MHNIRKHLLRFVVALSFVLFSCYYASAQKFALSTNLVEWANFGTINADAGLSVAQDFSLHAGAKFNPWSFHTKSGMQIYNKQTTAYFGARYWPWYVYSGWWIGARVRFMDFSETGVLRPKLFEGKSLGAGVLFGYTWMIHEHFNIEIGGGLWEADIWNIPGTAPLRAVTFSQAVPATLPLWTSCRYRLCMCFKEI